MEPSFYAIKLSIPPGGSRMSIISITNNFGEVKDELLSFFSRPYYPVFYGMEDAKIYTVNKGILRTIELRPLVTYPNIKGQKINLSANPYDGNYQRMDDSGDRFSSIDVEIDFSKIPIFSGSDEKLINKFLYFYLGIQNLRYGYNDLEGGLISEPCIDFEITRENKVEDSKLSEIEKQNKLYDDKINNSQIFMVATMQDLSGHGIDISTGIVIKMVAVGKIGYNDTIQKLDSDDLKTCVRKKFNIF